ncbi:hypothetical protein HDU97_008517 [Phlyctochytrium planicorne]|nr:hypothetical protein HDU97_008517 [Phlyctochytrium planicorne]
MAGEGLDFATFESENDGMVADDSLSSSTETSEEDEDEEDDGFDELYVENMRHEGTPKPLLQRDSITRRVFRHSDTVPLKDEDEDVDDSDSGDSDSQSDEPVERFRQTSINASSNRQTMMFRPSSARPQNSISKKFYSDVSGDEDRFNYHSTSGEEYLAGNLSMEERYESPPQRDYYSSGRSFSDSDPEDHNAAMDEAVAELPSRPPALVIHSNEHAASPVSAIHFYKHSLEKGNSTTSSTATPNSRRSLGTVDTTEAKDLVNQLADDDPFLLEIMNLTATPIPTPTARRGSDISPSPQSTNISSPSEQQSPKTEEAASATTPFVPSSATSLRVSKAKAYIEARYKQIADIEKLSKEGAVLRSNERRKVRYNPVAVIRWRKEVWLRAVKDKSKGAPPPPVWKPSKLSYWHVSNTELADWMKDAIILPSPDQNRGVKTERRSVSLSRGTADISRSKSTRTFASHRSTGSEKSKGSSSSPFPFLFAFQDSGFRRDSIAKSAADPRTAGVSPFHIGLNDKTDPSGAQPKEIELRDSPEPLSKYSDGSDAPVPLALAGKDLKHRRSQDLLRQLISPASSPLRLLSSNKANTKSLKPESPTVQVEEYPNSNFFDMFLSGVLPCEHTDPELANDFRPQTPVSPSKDSDAKFSYDENTSELTASGQTTDVNSEATAPTKKVELEVPTDPKRNNSDSSASHQEGSVRQKRGSIALPVGPAALFHPNTMALVDSKDEKPRFNFFGSRKKSFEPVVDDSSTSQTALTRNRSQGGTPVASSRLEVPSNPVFLRRASEPQLISSSSQLQILSPVKSEVSDGEMPRPISMVETQPDPATEPSNRTTMMGALVETVTGATNAVGGAVSGAAGSLAGAVTSQMKRRLRKERDLDKFQTESKTLEAVLSTSDLTALGRRASRTDGGDGDSNDIGAAVGDMDKVERRKLMKDVFWRQGRNGEKQSDGQRPLSLNIDETISPDSGEGGAPVPDQRRPESRGSKRSRQKAERLKAKRSVEMNVMSEGDEWKLEGEMVAEIGEKQRKDRLFNLERRKKKRSSSIKRNGRESPSNVARRRTRKSITAFAGSEAVDALGAGLIPGRRGRRRGGIDSGKNSPTKAGDLDDEEILEGVEGLQALGEDPADFNAERFDLVNESLDSSKVEMAVQTDGKSIDEIELEKALLTIGKRLANQIEAMLEKSSVLRQSVVDEIENGKDMAARFTVPLEFLDIQPSPLRILELRALEQELPEPHAPLKRPDNYLLTASLVKHAATFEALSTALNSSAESISNLIASVEQDEQTVKAMVKDLDEMAIEVNETWSRKLKVVEDRVQQDENTRLMATGAGKELWYQCLAFMLTALAFLIWLSYQAIKVGKFVSSFTKSQIKAYQDRAAAKKALEAGRSEAASQPQQNESVDSKNGEQAIHPVNDATAPQTIPTTDTTLAVGSDPSKEENPSTLPTPSV